MNPNLNSNAGSAISAFNGKSTTATMPLNLKSQNSSVLLRNSVQDSSTSEVIFLKQKPGENKKHNNPLMSLFSRNGKYCRDFITF